MKNEKYYLGLDIGTDSVGYAVVNPTTYEVYKFKGKPAWGVQIFDQAETKEGTRAFRVARRRLERRKQRVSLLQELFAVEVAKKDETFFKRIKESALFGDDGVGVPLFNDPGYTDRNYYAEYPTIHHLIVDLMNCDEPRDVRLVYLACAWLVAHRGHFLNNMDMAHLGDIRKFSAVYRTFESFFEAKEIEPCWEFTDVDALGDILRLNTGISAKETRIKKLLYGEKSPAKDQGDVYPYNRQLIIKLLAGGKASVENLFFNEAYKEAGSISLGMDEEKFAELMGMISEEDYELISVLRELFDWATLVKVLGDAGTVSEAKVREYEQHKEDLRDLKYLVKKYAGKDVYKEMFRTETPDSYTAYVYHIDGGYFEELKGKASKDNFLKKVNSVLKAISVEEEDRELLEDVSNRVATGTFMPKQKNTDNRVIPYQLYLYELRKVLDKAAKYLPFLKESQADGKTVCEKIDSIFLFRIPYFVGPLNPNSKYSWIRDCRKAGKIFPWNFEEQVDLDACEEEFIKKLTNTCTFLPGETVLPKDSLCYHRFMVLNEINNLRIRGEKISIELKQELYNEVFLKYRKVTRRRLIDYLISNGIISKGEEDVVTGIDIEIKANLAPQIAYSRLISRGVLSEEDAERIIERASYAEDKARLKIWLKKNYPSLNDEDRTYICGIKANDFGRLSRKLLCELEGVNKQTDTPTSIMQELWQTNNNFQEIIADSSKYTFKDAVEAYEREYYSTHELSLEKRLDDMYVSPSVRRPIIRAMDIVKDVVKAFGKPAKVFVEVTRGATEEQKGKRTKSRKEQLLDLYKTCKEEDVRLLQQQIEAMGDSADNRLQSDKLFLYFAQMGKSAYSDTSIELESLGNSKLYDIDHIYPQSVVDDDSILNNKVLCLSEENGQKLNVYPLSASIRHAQEPFWRYLRDCGLMTEEKYRRLTRSTGFTDEEKYEFINRQLTETSQASKAVAVLLQEKYNKVEVVYCKAKLAAEFRHAFDCLKSREFNDLHHAVDAYLNVVVGNVYSMKFSKQWFRITDKYNMKTEKIYSSPVICGGETVWAGKEMIGKVVRIARNQSGIRFTKYSSFKKGKLFDQLPVKRAEGLAPLKEGLDTTQYGGYNKASTMFFIPVRYSAKKKTETVILSVDLMNGRKFLDDIEFASQYAFQKIEKLIGKEIDEISFPFGMRPWKINTMLSLDGFIVCIAGSASGGKCLIAQPVTQFTGDYYWQRYVKKLSSLCEKVEKNSKYVYSSEYDEVTRAKNLELYDYYVNKCKFTIFRNRINSPIAIFEAGRDLFEKLTEVEQAKALLNMQQTFGRTSGGCDLTAIGGKAKAAATVSFSSTISNWAKKYKDVRIVDMSPSGLWMNCSENLLEL